MVAFNIEKPYMYVAARVFSVGSAEMDIQKDFKFSASTAIMLNLEAEKDSALFTIQKNMHKDEE